MNKKILIVIIAVLAVILLAGVFVLLVTSDFGKEPAAQPPEISVDMPDEPDASNEQTDDAVAPTAQGNEEEDPTDPATEATEPKPEETTPSQKDEKPTVPDQTKETTEPTEATMPELPTEPGTKVPETKDLDYLKYHNMSGAEQAAFINSFDSMDDFIKWYNAAKKEYEDSLIEIDDDTVLDIGGN